MSWLKIQLKARWPSLLILILLNEMCLQLFHSMTFWISTLLVIAIDFVAVFLLALVGVL